MKKIGKYLSIAFFLVIGATFADQINAAVDFLLDVDYTALGNTIADLAGKLADFFVGVYNKISEAAAS